MHAYARFRARAADLVRDPVAWTDLIQVVKTVVAAVVAWVLAAEVLDLPQPFLAPWAALLVVHATVYQSFWTGAKQVAATVVGVLLAWATGNTLGLDPVALGAMLLAGLASSRVRWLRDEGATVAATALIVLTTGSIDQDQVLVGRLVDTAIGVGVGLVVNALVWPPLLDLSAARAIESGREQIGALLADIAEECGDACTQEHVETWVRRSQDLDVEVDEAWALVRQARESGRLNPRRGSAAVREAAVFGEILDHTEQALAEIRSLARTVGHSIFDTNQWDDEFRERWTGLLRELAGAIQSPDSRRLGEMQAELSALAWDYSDEQLPRLHWPEYGGLILNLRNIATSMARVAASDPISSSTRGPVSRAAL